jgi:hypothetical protein
MPFTPKIQKLSDEIKNDMRIIKTNPTAQPCIIDIIVELLKPSKTPFDQIQKALTVSGLVAKEIHLFHATPNNALILKNVSAIPPITPITPIPPVGSSAFRLSSSPSPAEVPN